MKFISLPHVSTYKRRWARRLMIILTTPQAIAQALSGVFRGAAYWWKQP